MEKPLVSEPEKVLREPFARFPLFATDEELAIAIVGKERAKKWVREALPALKKIAGFPTLDKLHGGRPVPLVVKFYDDYFGLSLGYFRPDGEERMDLWRKRTSKHAPSQD